MNVPARRKRRFLRIGIATAGAIVGLTVVAWFVATRPAFIRAVVLRPAARALGTEIVADGIRFNLFTYIRFDGLRCGPAGEPLFTAKRLRLEYRILPLLHHRLQIEQVLLDSPSIRLVRTADGRLVVPGVKRPHKESAPSPKRTARNRAEGSGAGDTDRRGMIVTLGRVRVDHGTFVLVPDRGGAPIVRISDIQFAASNIRLNEPGRFEATWKGTVSVASGDVMIERATAEGQASGSTAADVLPEKIDATASVRIERGRVQTETLSGAAVQCTVRLDRNGAAPTWRIDTARLDATRGERRLAGIIATGVLGMHAPISIGITADIPDRVFLNLATAPAGVLFEDGALAYSGSIEFAPATRLVRSRGDLQLRHFRIAYGKFRFPHKVLVDATFSHDVTADLSMQRAKIAALTAQIQQEGRTVLQLRLQEPASVQWGAATRTEVASPEARIQFDLADFDISQLAGLVPPTLPVVPEKGTASVVLTVVLENDAHHIAVTGRTEVRDALFDVKGKRLGPVQWKQDIDAEVIGRDQIAVRNAQTSISVHNTPAARFSIQGDARVSTREAKAKITIEQCNEEILRLVGPFMPSPLPFRRVRIAGTAEGSYTGKTSSAGVKVELRMRDLALAAPANATPPPALHADLDLTADRRGDGAVDIRSLMLSLAAGETALANLRVSGAVHPTGKGLRAELQASSDDIDAAAIADVLASLPRTPQKTPPGGGPEPPGSESDSSRGAPPSPGAALQEIEAAVNLDLRRIRYRTVAVTNLEGQALLQQGTVRVNSMKCRLNGAPLELEGAVDLRKSPPTVRMKVDGSDLRIDPFVQAFAPDLAPDLSGSVDSLRLDFGGELTSPVQALRSLELDVNTVVGRVLIPTDPERIAARPALRILTLPFEILAESGGKDNVPLPGFLQRIQERSTTMIQERAPLRLDGATIRLRTRDGVLSIPRCELRNPIIEGLHLEGAVRFRDAPRTSALSALVLQAPIELKIGFRAGKVDVSIPVAGTIAKPRADLSGLLRSVLRELPKKSVETAVERLRRGQRIDGKQLLRELLGPVPEKSPPPEPEPNAQPTTEPAGETQPEQTRENPEAGQAAQPKPQSREERRKARRKALIDLGGAILNEILKEKE